jgi:hypothetical protein
MFDAFLIEELRWLLPGQPQPALAERLCGRIDCVPSVKKIVLQFIECDVLLSGRNLVLGLCDARLPSIEIEGDAYGSNRGDYSCDGAGEVS